MRNWARWVYVMTGAGLTFVVAATIVYVVRHGNAGLDDAGAWIPAVAAITVSGSRYRGYRCGRGARRCR